MGGLYDALDTAMTSGSGSNIGIRVNVSPLPFELSSRRSADQVHRVIRSYQRILIELWKANLLPDVIAGSPTWSAPVPQGPWMHVDTDMLLPLFVRTDESVDGLVYEVQSPGSWWGSFDALETVLRPDGDTLAKRFTSELRGIYPDGARIMHLFDSSTSPHENRYFANRVRETGPEFRYWGIDPDASQDECDLVRSHSYCSLVAEDMFRTRLDQLAAGRTRFDLPPIPIFDQKAAMAMPFDARYSHHFDDEHRAIFPFTSLIHGTQSVLESGDTVELVELFRRAPADRAYVLKYAGLDTTRNWGARGVFALRDLTADSMASLLAMLTHDASIGEPWILQAEAGSTGEVTTEQRDGTQRTGTLSVKVSHFLGPTRSLGKLVQASPGQVRWNSQSVISLVAESSSQS